ncbi:hypothetical protein Forpe1208_v006887 [Fusarium oxysporum f. sp. rapae]|uniref:Uncharacterized protein n=1 Tax=Fusarium oxysporum f. sp. rapae TaxID=485398 RepID=A0A8J5TVQ9_FUSOX|nr:hypothetical protein Forpe1208_v006887 [Fusarium oxysporum f. sp. rapae]
MDALLGNFPRTYITNTITSNEAADASVEDTDILTIFEAFLAENNQPINKTQGKKAVVQTRTESFQTAIEGEQTTPQLRREKRKAPKTPAARRRMRSHPLVDDDDEDDERRGRCQ